MINSLHLNWMQAVAMFWEGIIKQVIVLYIIDGKQYFIKLNFTFSKDKVTIEEEGNTLFMMKTPQIIALHKLVTMNLKNDVKYFFSI